MAAPEVPRLSMQGESAILLDAAGETFDNAVQERVWATAAAMQDLPGVLECVPGMNNLMLLFDPVARTPDSVEAELLAFWATVQSGSIAGRELEVPVAYGGAAGPDLAWLANHAGLSEDEVVRRHARALYSVAAVGFMPGFVYLSGLDPALAAPRRTVPVPHVPAGAVMIGGAQTGMMPRPSPTGWYVIGRTDLVLFDPVNMPPAIFRPGDRIRFVPVPA